MQQAVLNERERFTQMQWDMEELRNKCMEMELKLKSAQVFSVPCIRHITMLVLFLQLLGNSVLRCETSRTRKCTQRQQKLQSLRRMKC